jgi:multiple sugar transport system permease protein
MMMSMAVVGLFWKLLYDPSWGPINYVAGLGKFAWLSNPDAALYAVAITDIWMWSPFVMLLSLAGLSAVPEAPLRSAAIDRAGRGTLSPASHCRSVLPLADDSADLPHMEAFKTFDLPTSCRRSRRPS